jgi:hypothetical protein
MAADSSSSRPERCLEASVLGKTRPLFRQQQQLPVGDGADAHGLGSSKPERWLATAAAAPRRPPSGHHHFRSSSAAAYPPPEGRKSNLQLEVEENDAREEDAGGNDA